MKKLVCNLLFIMILCVVGCEKTPDTKANIVCTTTMITDVTRIIAGDKVNVIGLMGAGIDPHLYKATAQDVKLFNEAELIFYNGLDLEAKMDDFLVQLSSKKPVIAISDSINKDLLIKVDNNLYDPHIWFDLELFSIVILEIKNQLVDTFPDHKSTFLKNYLKLQNNFEILKKSNKKLIDTLKPSQKVLITAHDAFGYFGKAYGFEVLGLQGVSTQSEAGLADVNRLANLIVQKNVPAIFVESSVSPRQIKAVQEAVKAKGATVEIGGQLFSDALGNKGTDQGTYIGMFDHNVKTIVNALTGSKNLISKGEKNDY